MDRGGTGTSTEVMTEIQSQVARVAADVFSIPVEEITAESSPQTIITWDSVQHLILVLALEEEVGVRFEPSEVEKMTSVAEIVRTVERHLASA
jgi:acyl carrier protein